eukprot:TRINITY_DN70611_c0_g1_i1.p1 TRINITY_DN70611_c0_g1~~TRINITY_DN70611_c0_g1_i1.p1  ORF type:complete len:194 (+),score=12.21 TRINITY_DN70611_c0_g1_i1:90-671(+)
MHVAPMFIPPALFHLLEERAMTMVVITKLQNAQERHLQMQCYRTTYQIYARHTSLSTGREHQHHPALASKPKKPARIHPTTVLYIHALRSAVDIPPTLGDTTTADYIRRPTPLALKGRRLAANTYETVHTPRRLHKQESHPPKRHLSGDPPRKCSRSHATAVDTISPPPVPKVFQLHSSNNVATSRARRTQKP